MLGENDVPRTMSEYDQASWRHLEAHWHKKAKRRELLSPKAHVALGNAALRSRDVISTAATKLSEHTPEPVKRAGGFVVDQALVPTVKAAEHLLHLAEGWAAELVDPETVLKHHRKHGRAVETIPDLRGLDLEDLDRFSRRMALRWSSTGAVEGAGLGTLAFVPVVGTGFAITADVLVMQMLSVGIASQAMYSYGYDARHPDEQQMVERMVRRAYAVQASKVGVVRDATRARTATIARERWSQKVREDHKIMAAVERLMNRAGDGKVGIKDVSKKMPYIGVVTSAGANAYVLGDIAKQAVLYGRTRHLSEKYDLPLPASLLPPTQDDGAASDSDESG